ncbi:5333_t:CDS:2 [Ambispora leptoticha]|uniref:5333_t:CDS:1 n=1 Tax=Ambispora leptoticha TaxID=144679 RepID=A0A9N9HTV0_9GLOM|nr:5333_t:CDS:2 [Ambispora leptoticha]
MDLQPNVAASVYLATTFLCIAIALAIPYQFFQILRYTRRQKNPQLIDLPTVSREKITPETSNDYSMSTAFNVAVPEVKKIRWGLMVIAHKIWNYGIFVFGFGDQSVGEIAIFLAYIVLNLTFVHISFQSGESINTDFADRTAYLALANSAFVFPLATRNSVFLTLLGVPFERVIKYHRWVGRMIFFMIAFHGASHIQDQYKSTNSVYDTLFGDKKYFNGFLAFMSLVVIMLTSHSVVRRFAFEVFYWSHFIFIFFVIFGILHTEWFTSFVLFGIILYIIDRFVRAFLSFRARKVISIDAIQTGVTRVVFESNFFYEAGQYVFVSFPNLGSPLLSFLRWHPVSLSSAPSASDGSDQATFHLKCAGGFTKSLYERAQNLNVSLKLKVDGPYGKTSIDFMEYQTVLLVGGGIGITPIISLLRDLVDRQITGFPLVTQSIYFVWVIPDLDSYAWFSSEFAELRNRASASLAATKYLLDIKIFLTKSETTPSSIFFKGRPDFEHLLHKIKDFHGSGDIAVGACGPTPMIREIRKAAVNRSDAMGLIKVHTETFEL